MALIIEGGISIGGNIIIVAENINPTANLVVFYDAGNSMSYSGSGISFDTDYTGPNLNTYQQYGVLDLAGLTGGPWNSGLFNTAGDQVTWTSQGVASYWSLISDSQQYLDSTYQQESPTLNSPTYTIVSVVRPQDFAAGAIVGGDENIFYFNPVGGVNDGPTVAANNAYGPGGVMDITTVFELDTWYCVAVTYDATSGTMKLYTNGVLVATATSVDSPTHPTGLYWGTLEGQLWFTGGMAVCMAYERVLDASEISQLSDVYLSRYVEPAQTSSALFTYPYMGGPPTSFTVPEGVYSISAVAVGGGGGGTSDEYAIPGGDSVMLRMDSSVYVNTTYTGTTNTIVVDTAAYPNIANVTVGNSWIVGGNDIHGPNAGIPGWDLVTAINTDDPGNTVITINKSIDTTAGDSFFFYQAVVAAEGGYENPAYFYNQANQNPSFESPNGPGARALPLVTDGPYGAGGVVDWTTGYPIGGGGAGGYGISGLALNVDQAGDWIYVNSGPDSGNSYHTMSFSENLLTVTALIGIGTSQANQECTVVGTETVTAGNKAMFSVNITQTAGIAYCGVGLANYNENLQQYAGYSVNSVGYYDDGRVFIDSNNVETFDPFNEGGIVDIAVDIDAGLAWFRVSGGPWNGDAGNDPSAGTGGLDISALTSQGYPVSLALSPWYDDNTSTADVITINTESPYSIPVNFGFIPGVPGAGGTGGDGTAYYDLTAKPGTGGSGGGGGGRLEDSGAGGGGTSLYGRYTSGNAGSFVNTITDPGGIALGGDGGGNPFTGFDSGGQATPWNGGRGGWPGGAGASATGYWVGGNGGALAYRNNYAVTPGEEYTVLVGVGGQGQNDGGSGAHGAIRIVWPGNTRQFPTTDVSPDSIAVPTLVITAHDFPNFSPTGSITYDISSDGNSTVLETGVVWGLSGQATYLDSTDVCDGSSSTAERKAIRADNDCGNAPTAGLTGSQTISFNSYQFDNEEIEVRAYARNAAGVAYSNTLTWTPVICLAEGTLITLADGTTKTIETVTMSDSLKVWDFDNRAVTSATPLWIKKKESTIQYNLIKFSDGSELKTIGQHRIFNKQAGAFTYPMTDATPVGTITVKSDGTEVTVTSKRVIYESVNYYNVITSGGYLNMYANDILTSMRYNNIYPITDMQYVKDNRALRNSLEFAGIADRWIDGLRLQEQTIDIKQIKKYVERLERNEKTELTLGIRPSWHK